LLRCAALTLRLALPSLLVAKALAALHIDVACGRAAWGFSPSSVQSMVA
jgi:hypothetical protein